MPKHNPDTGPIEITLLRAMMRRHTAGWVVQQLATLQEEEEQNTFSAGSLRSILVERNGITYVDSEKTKSVQRHGIPPREPHIFR